MGLQYDRNNILIESLVGDGNGAIKIVSLIHVTKSLAKRSSSIGIPRVLSVSKEDAKGMMTTHSIQSTNQDHILSLSHS